MAPSATTGGDEEAIRTEERLKSALWYSVGRLTDHECLTSLSSTSGSTLDSTMRESTSRNASPQFIGALTELVWAQVCSAGTDLEGFARHAGRGTIGVADVLLLARRNDGLEGLLKEFATSLQSGRKGMRGGDARSSGSEGDDGRQRRNGKRAGIGAGGGVVKRKSTAKPTAKSARKGG